ncbi:hypothetical protein HK104_008903 [Borealophlyctis nickersoniae]|nr:hypothetical protein HK104_008903 [Borealophlyctis nickersoniae]
MLEAIRLCAKARKEQGQDVPVDVDVHPDYPEFRGIELKGKKVAWQKDPTVKQMEDAGAKVHQKDAPHLTCNEFFFVSGEIPRRTEYETGLPQIRWFPESKSWEPDPLIMDERFVIVNVKDKGMVLFTGCSHAGLVNVCLHAKELFPHLPLHAVIGGYHLAGRNESRIEATIKDLSNLDLTPHVFLPGHCTGWKARSALESAFPGKVVPIAAGNTVHIEAEHSGDEHLI